MARRFLNGFAFCSLLACLSLPVSPANAQVTFSALASYPTGQNPQFVATGDLNNDGAPDVVVVNTSSNSISILLNKRNGTGSLSAPTSVLVGTSPSWAAIADVNSDGKQDVVVANATSGTVSVLLGNGDGTLQAARTAPILPANATGTPSPTSLAVADVNEDGHPDIVVANSGTNNVSVLLGKGDGTFTVSGVFATGTGPDAVSVARFTSGPHVDIVTSNKSGRNVSVLLGNGDGTFQAAKNSPAGYVPYSVMAGDFDGDGIEDAIVTDNMALASGINFLKGLGNGTFQKPVLYAGGKSPIGATLGDFNKDGRPDVAIINTGTQDISVFVNTGSGFSAPIALAPGVTHLGAGVADFDGDSIDDLVLANSPSGVTELLNVTASLTNFLIAPNTLLTGGSTVATVTLSRAAPPGGALITLSNDSPTVAWVPANITIDAGAKTATFHVSTNAPNSGTVTISASYGGVTVPATLTVNPTPPGPLKADINGDGKVDLLDLQSLARIVSGMDPMK